MRRLLVVVVVALMCTVWPVAGQSTFGSIVGVVHDPSEAPVARQSRYEVWKTTALTQ